MEIEDIYKIVIGCSGKTEEELKAMPPEEFARHIIKYVNTLEQDMKDRFLEEFYEHFQKNTRIITPDADFAKEFPEEIKIENGQYKIYETLRIEKDLVFPKGVYNICQGQKIRAENCIITILPGTKFLLNNNTSMHFAGGQLIAAGNEQEKIEFAPAGKIMSANISLDNVVDAKLEQIIIKNLNDKYYCFKAENSNVLIKLCEIRGNKNNFEIAGGEALIEDTKFCENIIKSQYDGSIGITNCAKVQLKKCRIENNTADQGGGINVTDGSKVSIDDCDIEGNTANQGGGIYSDEGNIKITNTRIKRNTAEEKGHGGGIEADGGKITLDDKCIIEGNSEPQINGKDIKYNPAIIKDGNK